MTKDEVERIFDRAKHEVERAKHELIALLCSEPAPDTNPKPLPVWMSKEQLAAYWKLKGTSGILSWTKRKPNEHPLPHAYMGDLLRFKRDDCDRWAYEEGQLGNEIDEIPTDKDTKRRGLAAVAPPQGA